MSGLKIISMIFPFIREMILGDKTLLEAIKTNKLKVLLLAAIMASFFLNVTMIPKLIEISNRYVRLHDRYELIEKERDNLKQNLQNKDKELAHCTPDSALPTPPPTAPEPPATSNPANVEAGYARLNRTYHQAAPAPHRPKGKPTRRSRESLNWQSEFDEIRSQEKQYNETYKHH